MIAFLIHSNYALLGADEKFRCPVALRAGQYPIGLDSFLVPSGTKGAVAQLGERLICIQEVAGSIPTSSTMLSRFLRLTANPHCGTIGR